MRGLSFCIVQKLNFGQVYARHIYPDAPPL